MNQEGLSKRMYLFRVSISRERADDSSTSDRSDEYHVAETIEQVWEAIALYLEDLSVEVECIKREVPVLSVLRKKKQPKEEE